MNMIFVKCISLIIVTYVSGTHWNCIIEASNVHLQHMFIQ